MSYRLWSISEPKVILFAPHCSVLQIEQTIEKGKGLQSLLAATPSVLFQAIE
jgi:hypothetical protein